MSLRELSDDFELTVKQFRSRNIPVEVQKSYPGNILAGISAYINLTTTQQLKFNYFYSATNAYSLYGDYSGTLDLVSKVTISDISLCYSKFFLTEKQFNPYLELSAGYVTGRYSIRQNIHFFDYPPADFEYNFTGDMLVLEPGIGVRYKYNSFFNVYMKAGYKFPVYSITENISDVLQINGITIKTGIGIEI